MLSIMFLRLNGQKKKENYYVFLMWVKGFALVLIAIISFHLIYTCLRYNWLQYGGRHRNLT